MNSSRAPRSIPPWVATVAKWGSLAIAAAGIVYGFTHGMPNIMDMFHWDRPTALQAAGGIATHLAIPSAVLGAGLTGYYVAGKTEDLADQVSAEKEMRARDRKRGIHTPSVSILMEPENKLGKKVTTAGALLGFSAMAGGGMAAAHWIIGGMALATIAMPVIGAGLFAVGSMLAATSLFAKDAGEYARSRDTQKERRHVLAEAQMQEIGLMQTKLDGLSDRLDAAMTEAKFHHRQHRDTQKSFTRAEDLRRARKLLERAEDLVAAPAR